MKLKEIFSGETKWFLLLAAIMIVLFFIIKMKTDADKKRQQLLSGEQKYLQGTYYLNKQAQPDPYPNFPGSIV